MLYCHAFSMLISWFFFSLGLDNRSTWASSNISTLSVHHSSIQRTGYYAFDTLNKPWIANTLYWCELSEQIIFSIHQSVTIVLGSPNRFSCLRYFNAIIIYQFSFSIYRTILWSKVFFACWTSSLDFISEFTRPDISEGVRQSSSRPSPIRRTCWKKLWILSTDSTVFFRFGSILC